MPAADDREEIFAEVTDRDADRRSMPGPWGSSEPQAGDQGSRKASERIGMIFPPSHLPRDLTFYVILSLERQFRIRNRFPGRLAAPGRIDRRPLWPPARKAGKESQHQGQVMPGADIQDKRRKPVVRWTTLLAVLAGGGALVALYSSSLSLSGVLDGIRRTIWIVPLLVCLHLAQLLLAGIGWRCLFTEPPASIRTFYRLRIIREGIDSLLPVAQVGGEFVGARLLSQQGVAASSATASVIVDVTIELLTQLVFLAAGLCTLSWLSHGAAWGHWMEVFLVSAAVAAALLLAQRFGMLRLVEGLLRGMAARWPAVGRVSPEGLHAAALGFYRQHTALSRGCGLHLLAWAMGSIETWAVLNVLGISVTALAAFTIESLGMAARSTGFAIPAALGAQEGGFVLAAAALGVPVTPALTLSIVKRMREVLVGFIGLALWRQAIRRKVAS
jgi:putative membrane protein